MFVSGRPYLIMAPRRAERRPMAGRTITVSVAPVLFLVAVVAAVVAPRAARASNRRSRLGGSRPAGSDTPAADWTRTCTLQPLLRIEFSNKLSGNDRVYTPVGIHRGTSANSLGYACRHRPQRTVSRSSAIAQQKATTQSNHVHRPDRSDTAPPSHPGMTTRHTSLSAGTTGLPRVSLEA